MLTSACGFHDGEDGDNDDDDADDGQSGICAVCDDEMTRQQKSNDFDGGDYQHSTKADENDSYDPIECFLL